MQTLLTLEQHPLPSNLATTDLSWTSGNTSPFAAQKKKHAGHHDQ